MADGIDTWQAAQNWIMFSTLAGGIGVYYYMTRPTNARAHPPNHHTAASSRPQPVKKEPKKARSFEKTAVEPELPAAQTAPEKENVAKPVQPKTKEASSDNDFVRGMMKARQGISVKSSDKSKHDRLRTVKPKSSASALPSGVGQSDYDDGFWSPVISPLPKTSGVEDMLEAPAQGPSSLRITASEKPVKEKAARQPKKENVETKKQRQNRQKSEQQRVQRQEEEGARKALEEKQRRAAREARGEPAKNGIKSAPVPTTNVWSPLANAQATPGNNVPLLDTFDVESTSSSNDAQASTAATSTTDGAPTQWADEPIDEQLAEALKDSEVWNEVPTKQKSRTAKHSFNGGLTPAGGPVIANGSNTSKFPFSNKPNGFSALSVEDDG